MGTHTGIRETWMACATWKSYWVEERKGGYDCHKTALLLRLIFCYPAKLWPWLLYLLDSIWEVLRLFLYS